MKRIKKISIEYPNILIEQFQKYLKMDQSSSVHTQKTQPNKASWSPRLKHSDLSISGTTITRTARTTVKPVCCFGFMPDTDSKVSRWSFKIQSIQGKGIGGGMCLVGQSYHLNFLARPEWRNIGHGYYCIDSNGYVLSHIDTQINFELESFMFEQGEVLQFEYDKEKGKIIIKSGEKDYQMDVQKQDVRKYAICAQLCEIGDSIILISE